MKKTILLAAMCCLISMPLFAEGGSCGYNVTWDITNGVLTISGNGAMDDYYLDPNPWAELSYDEIVIEEGVTHIGSSAFYRSKATKVSISNTVTSIGREAFRTCNLSHVVIPNSVVSIGEGAFAYNNKLESITLSENITSIPQYLCCGCSSLKNITIPNGVITIGNRAFEHCKSLTNIDIPPSVTTIGFWTDGSHNNGYSTFDKCENLETVHIVDLDAWCKIKFKGIYDNPLYYAHHLILNGKKVTDLHISSNVGKAAFINCTDLSRVTFESGVDSIGYYAFSGCSDLWRITFSNSVTFIGRNAFSNCENIDDITIPRTKKVRTIEPFAFENCVGLTDVMIQCDTLIECPYVFAGCKNLEKLTWSVTAYLEYRAVYYPKCVGCEDPYWEYVDYGDEEDYKDNWFGLYGNTIIYVEANQVEEYRKNYAKYFKEIRPISATPVDVAEEVVIEAEETSVQVEWFVVEFANSYELTILRDGEVICTYTFDSDGNILQSLRFNKPSLQAETQMAGFQYTVTGLEPNTAYAYQITARNADEQVITTFDGTFSTLDDGSATAIETVNLSENEPTGRFKKIMENGQLYILNDGKRYTVTGVEVD